jgi:hypothetical protein
MRQLRDYSDDRLKLHCAYCSGDTATRDHVPSKVLLQSPYPDNLPVVPACAACNASFSLDEEYVACFLSAVLAGTTDPTRIGNVKAARILSDKPALRSLIDASRHVEGREVTWRPDADRVEAIVLKLARGHVRYEFGEARDWPPDEIWFAPLSVLGDAEREVFENPDSAGVWPEVGSRAMQRLVVYDAVYDEGWVEVQEGVYRYHLDWSEGVVVRIVLSEYLAAFVRWDA